VDWQKADWQEVDRLKADWKWEWTCHARKATAATASAVETPKSQALDRPCISIIAKPCALED
jgi:hypothetical protein